MVGGALFLNKRFTESVAIVLSCIFFLHGFKMVGKRGFQALQISPHPPIKLMLLLNILDGKNSAKTIALKNYECKNVRGFCYGCLAS